MQKSTPFLVSVCFFFGWLLSCVLPAGPFHSIARADEARVLVIPVSGEVSPAMAAFVERATRDAQGAALVVFEMDTFGGRVDSALKIVDAITALETPSVAWVKTKAISAGALIALSADALTMSPGTTIGDCAPIAVSQEGPKMLGEKFQSPLRAKFRALARKNGYSEALAESMVTAELEIVAYEAEGKTVYLERQAYEDLKVKPDHVRTVVREGELLTMDDVEAKAFGFSKATLKTIAEVVAGEGKGGTAPERVDPSWSEDLSGWILSIAPILMIVGLGALYTELKAPGFGIFGIVGLSALALALFGHHIAGLATYAEILIIVIGVLLLVVEIFVLPGFGVAGIIGFLLVMLGLILSLQDFVLPDPDLPWEGDLFRGNLLTVVASFGASLLMAMAMLRYLVPAMAGRVSGPYLDADLKASHADSKESARIEKGATGVALSPLRPAGKAAFYGEPFDVVTRGDFIDRNEHVVVTAVEGNRVIVARKVSPSEPVA
ncbi:NfeD family protein [Desulfoluna spongiiphila]|uniref:Membrane-bound serine protease (ClpP class) n=1 Tax=Desulfoluna spongiiphila TaxID=419481 RepID=A0A1G5IAR1_9BACT|nr:NfeD family protein [Desulfoluna spongiiphila]SCY72750.1 membrane-bound serine protease (ClpP class) [Desulfoluna spongiiphila]